MPGRRRDAVPVRTSGAQRAYKWRVNVIAASSRAQIHIRRPERPSSSVTSSIGNAGSAPMALNRLRRGLMLNDVLGEWEEQSPHWYSPAGLHTASRPGEHKLQRKRNKKSDAAGAASYHLTSSGRHFRPSKPRRRRSRLARGRLPSGPSRPPCVPCKPPEFRLSAAVVYVVSHPNGPGPSRRRLESYSEPPSVQWCRYARDNFRGARTLTRTWR
jgi:hypothetical protein